MTHPLLSEALKEAYASAFTEVEVIDTLSLWDGVEEELYICSGHIQRTLLIAENTPRTFLPFPFKISKELGVSESGAASITVAVENVNGTVATFLRNARAARRPVTVQLRTYLSNSSLPQNSRPINLELTGADITLSGVTLTASTPDVVNKAFPNAYYSYTTYPGLRG